MLIGEKERALKLLEYLRRIDNNDERKTEELKTIQEFLEMFYEKGNMDVCYEICTQGIGDLIIGLETLPDRTFITTNYKESEILCPAILQNYNILRKENHQALSGLTLLRKSLWRKKLKVKNKILVSWWPPVFD